MSTSMNFPNHSKALLEQVLTSLEDLNRKDINRISFSEDDAKIHMERGKVILTNDKIIISYPKKVRR